MTATLPTLALTDDGRITNPTTGELLDETAAADALAETLRTYARAKVERDALAMRMSDAESVAVDTARRTPEYLAIASQANDAEQTMRAIQASLDGLFAGRDGSHPVKVDMGDVMCSWGKARETVTLAKPASWYATDEARRELLPLIAGYIGVAHDEPFVVNIVNRVFAWLAPTTKTGELPGASITVRGGQGGAR